MHFLALHTCDPLSSISSNDILAISSKVNCNRLTTLTAIICETPIATIAIVDKTFQRVQSIFGVSMTEMADAFPLITNTICGKELYIVQYALKDPVLANVPLFVGGRQLRFYAGTPLVSADGTVIGALTVMDYVSRALTDTQIEALQTFAEQVAMQREFFQRRSITESDEASLTQMSTILVDRQSREDNEKVFHLMVDTMKDYGFYMLETNGLVRTWNAGPERFKGFQAKEIMGKAFSTFCTDGGKEIGLSSGQLTLSDEAASLIGAPLKTSLTTDDVVNFYASEGRKKIRTAFHACIRDGTPFGDEFEIVTFKDRRIWIRCIGHAVRDSDGTINGVYGAFQDITGEKQVERALSECNRKLTNTLESITDAFFTLDREWRFTYVNKEAERVLRRTRAELLNKIVWDEFKEAVDSAFYHEYHRAVRDSCTVTFQEFYFPLRCWIEAHCYPSDEGLTVYFRDISEQKQYEAELEYRATHDVLTRLPNHGLLQDQVLQAISRANGGDKALAILIADFGRIQIANDLVGREAADQMLCQMAGRLQALFHKSGTVARQGGDEFVVVVEQVESEQQCAELARLIMQAMATPFAADGREFYANSSIGIALYPRDGTTAAELLKNADAAMGRAKQLGRNNFQFYTAAMNERALLSIALENELRKALERDEFVLHYQPQVDLQTGAVVGVETLIRWQHPERGLIQPDQFIALAENTGLIVPIGSWVLRAACAQASAWQRAGMGNLRVAVNLSASQFAQPDFACVIASALQETGLAPTMLDLELTESLVMTDVERAISILNDLRAMGVRLSIDDFGTGYSSLSYLSRFPIDVLKIDRSFVNRRPCKIHQTA